MNKTMEEKIELTVEWIREQVRDSKTNGVIVGLSGGIDSAVVACLLKKAFPDQSMGVILPCKSSPKDELDATELAKAIDIPFVKIDLSDAHGFIYEKVEEQLSGYDVKNARLADANLRARLRMSSIYAIANSLGYLVAGTDNAAEILTGYFTKYGDGGVDIVPIGNLLKREVFQWAKALGVPQSILERQPSAGLWEGQTDESEMGTTYDYIDDYLLGKSIPEKDRLIIEKLNRSTEHKRKLAPVPPKF